MQTDRRGRLYIHLPCSALFGRVGENRDKPKDGITSLFIYRVKRKKKKERSWRLVITTCSDRPTLIQPKKRKIIRRRMMMFLLLLLPRWPNEIFIQIKTVQPELGWQKKVSSSYKDISQSFHNLKSWSPTSPATHTSLDILSTSAVWLRSWCWGGKEEEEDWGSCLCKAVKVDDCIIRIQEMLAAFKPNETGQREKKRIWKKSKRELPFTVDLVNTANPFLFFGRVLSGDAVTYHVGGGGMSQPVFIVNSYIARNTAHNISRHDGPSWHC